MPARDTFTSTVDGAAAHAAQFAVEDYDDGPSLDEVQDDRPPRPRLELCKTFRSNADGSRTYCLRPEHGPDVQHEPYPYSVPAEAFAPGGWMQEEPF